MLISNFSAPLPELISGVSDAAAFLGPVTAARIFPGYGPAVDALVELFIAGTVIFHHALERPGVPFPEKRGN